METDNWVERGRGLLTLDDSLPPPLFMGVGLGGGARHHNWAGGMGFFTADMNKLQETERTSSRAAGSTLLERADLQSSTKFAHSIPTNIGIAKGAHSLSVATLVRHLGCSEVFISLIYHLYSVSTPGQVLK